MRIVHSILLCIPILTGVVVSVPLDIKYDRTTGLDQKEQDNMDRLELAKVDANLQIQKMREGINKYRFGTPEEKKKVKPIYEAAFGKKSDPSVVDNVIGKLQTGTLSAKVATHTFRGDLKDAIANVPWKKGKNGGPLIPGNAQFSSKFHGTAKDTVIEKQRLKGHGRTATLIHEATHQLAETGDYVAQNSHEIVKVQSNLKESTKSGYTSNINGHRTIAAVNRDKHFVDVRKKVSNMHDNAESYAIFASLCSRPGALRRRDVDLFNRALLVGDNKQLIYLARRNNCKLPKDYFAKKAAAQKTSGNNRSQKVAKVHPVKPAALNANMKIKTPLKGGMHGTKPKSVLSKQGTHGHSATQRVKTQHSLPSQKGTSRVVGQRVGKGAKGRVGPPRPIQKPVTHSAKKSPSRSSGKKTLPGHPTLHATKKPLSVGRPGSRLAGPPGRSVAGPSAKKPVARPVSNRPTRKPSAQHAPHSTSKKHPSKPITPRTKHLTKLGAHSTSKKPLARPAARPAPNRHASKQPVAKPVAHAARPTSRLAAKPAHLSKANHGKVAMSKGKKPQSATKRPSRPPPKPAKPAVKGRKH